MTDRDCPHGSLLRSCEICDLREELAATKLLLAEASKDAERYRRLRQADEGTPPSTPR
jgi:hypothetical protein